MQYALVAGVAVFVAGLTLFSGFGLGTLLMPAFALFLPVAVAVAATAVVHLANNLFKVVLVGRKASWAVVVRFGLPAAVGAIVGAMLLGRLANVPPLLRYSLGSAVCVVTPVKLTVAVLMLVFALFELHPGLRGLSFDRRYLLLGGLLSGFFGGLSGHQGALRSAFLVKAGLGPRAFIGTSVVVAVLVDLARLAVYGVEFRGAGVFGGDVGRLVLTATVAAFVGSFVGARLVHRATLPELQVLVAVLLLIVAVGLDSGLI